MTDRLLFVRHGETDHNVNGIAQGWSDSDLSENGRLQVKQVAERLARESPGCIYTSTLGRAMTTAKVIASRCGLEPRPMDDLREMNCGRWEGLSFQKVREEEPELFAKWSSDPTIPCPGGGESLQDVQHRMQRAIEWILSERSGIQGTIVIVSHGLAIRIAAIALLGLELRLVRQLGQDNGSINILERLHSKWVLQTWNDTTHCP